jgi:hypothetical protein
MNVLPLLYALAVLAPAPAHRSARAGGEDVPASAAEPLSEEDLAARVRAYLHAIDTPIRDEQWRALGAAAVPRLRGVANDAAALPSRRARSVQGLGAIGGVSARSTVLDLARAEAAPFAVRASALTAAGRLLAPEDLLRELRPVLIGAREVHVRAAAADVLALHAGTRGCDSVRAQAGRESATAGSAFARALDRCTAENP